MDLEKLLDNTVINELISLYNSIPEIQFWIKDLQGKYVKTNHFLLHNYRLSNREEIIGKTDFDIAPLYIAEQWQKDDEAVLDGACIENRIELVSQSDLSIAWHVTNKRPLRTATHKIVGSCGTTRKLQEAVYSDTPFYLLMPAIEYIRCNIDKPFKVATLADLTNMSVSSFERKFKNYFMDSPLRFIKKLRLNLACQKLTTTDLSIAQIAALCGFCDQSYMTKEFHRVIGVTPAEYRLHPFRE